MYTHTSGRQSAYPNRRSRQTEGGSSGRRRLLRLEGGRFRMQIAKAHNQSAGGRYIFKRSAWVNTNVDKRGRPRFTPAHLYARSAYTHTYTLAAFRMQRGLRRGRERFEGVVHARGGHNLVLWRIYAAYTRPTGRSPSISHSIRSPRLANF